MGNEVITFWHEPGNRTMRIEREGRETIVTELSKAKRAISYMRKTGWTITNYGYKITATKAEGP